MKKTILIIAVLISTVGIASAQTEKGNYIIGSDLANLNLNFQKNNTTFGLSISPKVAWFIQDNFAIGGLVDLGLQTGKGFTNTNYGIGPLARYYFTASQVDVPKKMRFFGEANVGFFGQNTKVSGTPGVSTNGIGFGVGPGLAYFVNKNIALETLLKYNGTAGFGNSTFLNSVNLSLGFQIHLPGSKIKAMAKENK